MGHAYVKNLSLLVTRQVYARGKVSIKEMVDFAVEKGETIHASEGEYEDRFMLAEIIMTLVNFYLHDHRYTPQGEATPVLEPCDMDADQERVYKEWDEDGVAFDKWDADEDNPKSEFIIFDSIKWQFAPGWRERYPDVPLLEHYEN